MARNYHINWHIVSYYSQKNTLYKYIKNDIPQNHWNDTDNDEGLSLLHYACRGDNLDAIFMLVLEHKMNVNLQDKRGRTPIFYAVWHSLTEFRQRNLEILCSLGADPSIKNLRGLNALDTAISYTFDRDDCITLFISNGIRSKRSTIFSPLKKSETYFSKLEKRVIGCRDVIVTLLGLKKRRRDYQSNGLSLILPKLDRFLVKQVLAVEIWATRSTKVKKSLFDDLF